MGHLFTSIHLDWIHLTRSSLDEVRQKVKFDAISDLYYHKNKGKQMCNNASAALNRCVFNKSIYNHTE